MLSTILLLISFSLWIYSPLIPLLIFNILFAIFAIYKLFKEKYVIFTISKKMIEKNLFSLTKEKKKIVYDNLSEKLKKLII